MQECIGNRAENKGQEFFYCTYFVFNYFNSARGILDRVITPLLELFCGAPFNKNDPVALF